MVGNNSGSSPVRVPFIACQHVSLPLETRRRFSEGRGGIGSRHLPGSPVDGNQNRSDQGPGPSAGAGGGGLQERHLDLVGPTSWIYRRSIHIQIQQAFLGLFTNTGSGPVQGSWNWGIPGNSWDRSRCIRRKSLLRSLSSGRDIPVPLGKCAESFFKRARGCDESGLIHSGSRFLEVG